MEVEGLNQVDLAAVIWRKSTYSGEEGGNCVEAAALPNAIIVRDSKNRSGPALMFSRDDWKNFLRIVAGAESDRSSDRCPR